MKIGGQNQIKYRIEISTYCPVVSQEEITRNVFEGIASHPPWSELPGQQYSVVPGISCEREADQDRSPGN